MDRRDRLQPLASARGCNPAIEKSTLVSASGNGEQQDCEDVSNHDRSMVHGSIANARAGKPTPCSTFGQVTTMTAPAGGTLSRLAMASI